MTFNPAHYEQAAIRSLQSQGKDPWETVEPDEQALAVTAWEAEAREMHLLRMRLHFMEHFHLIVS